MFKWLERWRRVRNVRRIMAQSAARATDIKYAKMRVNLQMIIHMIQSMLTTHSKLISADAEFARLIRRYNRIHKRAMRIQVYVQNHDVSHLRMQRYGFTLAAKSPGCPAIPAWRAAKAPDTTGAVRMAAD